MFKPFSSMSRFGKVQFSGRNISKHDTFNGPVGYGTDCVFDVHVSAPYLILGITLISKFLTLLAFSLKTARISSQVTAASSSFQQS